MDTETTWTFPIPECNADAVRKKVAWLEKRAAKLGIPAPSVSEVGVEDKKVKDENGRKYIQRFIIFRVDSDVELKYDGWEFIATIEHGSDDDGNPLNVMRTSPAFEGELPKVFRTAGPTCDHCGLVRRRNETFVVAHDGGELRRVGRQCMKDYLGHKTATDILAYHRWITSLRAAFDDGMSYSGERGVYRFSVLEVLTRAATSIRLEGWVSRGMVYRGETDATATANCVWDDLLLAWGLRRREKGESMPVEPSEGDREVGIAALEWAREIDPDTDSDYLHNLRVILGRGSVSNKEVGLAVSAVAVWLRERDRLAAKKARMALPSEWVGEVGQRFGGKGKNGIPGFQANVLTARAFEGYYGLVTLVVVQDDSGNEFIWFASGTLDEEIKAGARVEVIGTIKAHVENDKTGRKQTKLTRASLTPVSDAGVAQEATTVEAVVEPAETPAPAPSVATGGKAGHIVMTAKTVDGAAHEATFTSAADAIEAAAEGRAKGLLNWRTIRYTVDGERVTTATLRKMAR